MAQWMTLIPAYGRDYKNQTEVKKDWNDNKDFFEPNSCNYINKEDVERFVPDAHIHIRYAKKLKVVQVK